MSRGAIRAIVLELGLDRVDLGANLVQVVALDRNLSRHRVEADAVDLAIGQNRHVAIAIDAEFILDISAETVFC